MASDVDICNLALARLGDGAQVASINPPDQSAQAYYCAQFYPLSLSAVLDEHNWSFTTKTVTLAQTTNPSSLWAYCYEVPSDMIGVIAVFDANATGDVGMGNSFSSYYGNPLMGGGNQQSYSVETDANGNGVLYSNQMGAALKYSASITNTNALPPSFVQAVSWHLASTLAGVIIKGDVGVSAAMKCLQAYQMALKVAKESDSQNRKIDFNYLPEGIRARA